MSFSLANRVAVVTGASRGIGRAHALELARHGAFVVVNDIAEGAGADGRTPIEAVVDEITAQGGVAFGYAASVSDMAAVTAMVEQTVERFGRLDVVVNNAGILRDKMIASMSESDFDAVLEVHLKGTWVVTRAAAEHWRNASKRGEVLDARIINTTSGTGLFGNVGQANYGAAKAGIANLTMISAMELERYGVTVNAVSPIARTRMTEGLGALAQPVDGTIDRFDPVHAARVVTWLASAESRWLSGAVLRVDGTSVYRMIPWTIDADVAYHGGSEIEPSHVGSSLRGAFGVFPAGMPKGGITRGS